MKLWTHTRGSGPDLVLLHGWGMNAGVWQPVLDRFAQRARVTLIELPGHGDSGFDEGLVDLDQWTATLLAQAPERALWLGWSLGGLLAQNAALLAPERVSGLLVMTGTPRFVQADDWAPAMPAATFRQFADALGQDATATLNRFLGLQVRGAEGASDLLRQLKGAVAERPPAKREALYAGLDLLLRYDLRSDLRRIDCPAAWILGERDTLVPAALAEQLSELMPKAVCHVIPGAAHAPFLSHTGVCMALIDEFMNDV